MAYARNDCRSVIHQRPLTRPPTSCHSNCTKHTTMPSLAVQRGSACHIITSETSMKPVQANGHFRLVAVHATLLASRPVIWLPACEQIFAEKWLAIWPHEESIEGALTWDGVGALEKGGDDLNFSHNHVSSGVGTGCSCCQH
jgi:hypothetical protein